MHYWTLPADSKREHKLIENCNICFTITMLIHWAHRQLTMYHCRRVRRDSWMQLFLIYLLVSKDIFEKSFILKTSIFSPAFAGERPYRCEICNKGFTLASTLNTHRRTHAEKKPFGCQYCGKDFYQRNALKSHLLASHPYTGGESLLWEYTLI